MKLYQPYARTLTLAVLLLTGQACKDTLNEVVVSNIGNNYMNTAAGFNAATNAAYSALRTFYGTEEGLTMTEYGTDIYRAGADGSFKGFHFYDSQLNTYIGSSGTPLQVIWDGLYQGINTCNAVIGRAPNVAGLTDAVKKQRVAEAKFLRAHYYFILLQQYGGVDLRLTETIEPTKQTSRASEADMYTAILADLTAALPDLDPKPQSADYGRATKAAAEHLLARVYLTKATSSAKAPDDYAKAAQYAQNVISNYGFKLLPDFASVFAQGAGELNSEVIFAVQYTQNPLNNGNGNSLHLYFGMQYDVQAGMVRDVANGRPFKRLRPTNYLTDVVFKDRLNDSRYKKSFKDTWYSNKPGGPYTNLFDQSKKSVTFSAGDTSIYVPGVEWTLAQRAAKPYQVLVPSLYNAALFPTLSKFLDPLRPSTNYTQGSRDYLAFRLAETYLILAEAQLVQGKTTEAAAALNVVRQRAAWPGKQAAMTVAASDVTMDLLMEERARELAGEQIRWMDLKRWGNLVDRVQKYNPDAAPTIKPFHTLRPIPQTQIDRSVAGAFAQNQGY